MCAGLLLSSAAAKAQTLFPDKLLSETKSLTGASPKPGYKGPVLIQFWASWCNRCASMFEDLSQFAADHPELPVIALSIDEEESTAREYLTKHTSSTKTSGPLSLRHDQSGQMAKEFKINAVPTVLLINADGTVLSKTGGHLRKSDLLKISRKLQQ